MGNSKFLDSKGNDFTKHIDNIVAERYECFKSANERLYYKFTDKMIEGYLRTSILSKQKIGIGKLVKLNYRVQVARIVSAKVIFILGLDM